MNTKTRTVMTLLTMALTFGLFPDAQPSLAQSARGLFMPSGHSVQSTSAQLASSDCRAIKGRGLQVFDSVTGVISGPVTNAGNLNGTLEDVVNFGAGVVFTPDPTVVAYTTDLTITTIHGQLKVSPVTTQSIVTGAGTEWGNINPTTSTGRFAGATGTIFITFKPIGDPSIGPYEAAFSGEICLAN